MFEIFTYVLEPLNQICIIVFFPASGTLQAMYDHLSS